MFDYELQYVCIRLYKEHIGTIWLYDYTVDLCVRFLFKHIQNPEKHFSYDTEQ